MIEDSEFSDTQMTHPAKEDWAWITQRYIDTAWESLPPNIQQTVPKQEVVESMTEQIARMRASHGETNRVYVLRVHTGERAGFVWVGQVSSGFTGQLQALILEIFVEPPFRGRGYGAQLMAQAEGWTRKNGLNRIGLSVAVHNRNAQHLYENQGYKVEMLRMFKDLNT